MNNQPMPLQPRDRWPELLDQKLPQFFSPAETILNFFTDEEIDQLTFHLFRTFKRYRSYKGGTFKFEKLDCGFIWEMIYPRLKNKFEWLRQDDILDGNGYITATDYALHMDSCNPTVYFNANQIAIKSLIIPLFVCKPDNGKDSKFVLFKNRLLGWECNFSNQANNVNMTYQQNVSNYEGLPWIDVAGNVMDIEHNKLYVDEETYKNHLSHLPRETCHGMVLESIQSYIPKSLMIFDPYQPHTTANHNYSKTNLKGGIRFNIQRYIKNL